MSTCPWCHHPLRSRAVYRAKMRSVAADLTMTDYRLIASTSGRVSRMYQIK